MKLDLSFEMALAICLGIYYSGTLVAIKTKAKIPGLLFSSFIMLIGFWTILPLDIVTTSKLDGVYAIGMAAIMVNIGTLFSIKQLKQDWKVVAITLIGIVAMTISILLVATPLFGREVAIAAIPPIAGGGIAVALMSEAANAKGLEEIAVLCVMILTMQGFVGMPLMSVNLKKEAQRIIQDFRQGAASSIGTTVEAAETGSTKSLLCEKIPKAYRNANYYLFVVFLVGALAAWSGTYISAWTGGLIGSSIVGLLLGAILYGMGLMEKDPLTKSGAYVFLSTGIMINVIGGLNKATIETFTRMLVPLAGVLVIAAVGVWVIMIPVGKLFGMSRYMAVAIAANMFMGFPRNSQITEEVVTAVGDTIEEREFLRNSLLPKIILGGVVSVSVTSVIMAGLLASLL